MRVTNKKRAGSLTPALLVVLCGLAIAACGSSGDPNRPSESALRADGFRYAHCMRSHGVPNFPDPTSNGKGLSISINSASGIDPFSPAFKAAQTACHKLLPFGGPSGNGHPSARAERQMLAISTCMRAHGITDFPDPTTKPPSTSASPGRFGVVMGHDGVFLAIPSSIDPNSPAFRAASSACHFGGPPGGR